MARNEPRFFIGFGFKPESELYRLYEEVSAELYEHCGIKPLSRTHAPHLTVFPPAPLGGCGIREAVDRLLVAASNLPPLALPVAGWDWFGGPNSSSTLYLKVVQTREFRALLRRLVKAMAGRLAPHEPYIPHVSFARWLTPEQRLSACMHMAGRPAVPLALLALDELCVFEKHNRGYRAHTCIPIPATR